MIRMPGRYDSPTCSASPSRRSTAPSSSGSPSSSGGELPRALEEVTIGAQAGEAEVGEPGLAGADELPLAADLEIALGELEAVGRRHQRLEPLDGRLGELVPVSRDEEAVRLLGPAADAATELVQLGEAEPVGLLHDHDRRVRHVDADLDHRRRDEHVELPFLERGHRRTALPGLEPAVDAADLVATQLVRPQPCGLVLRGACECRLGGFDERADDVGLAAVVEVRPEPRVGLRAPLLGDPRRRDRLAVRRRGRDLGHGEVAVDRQRQRAGDRRRGHVQDVGAPSLGERGPLLDAEAMLLVDDRDGEVGELHFSLDERVRPHGDADVARGDELMGGPPLARREARGEQGDADAELSAERLDRQEVLLRERLRRRHQRSLAPSLDRPQQRVERDRRLPGADVPLEQPLHRRREGEVGVDLHDRRVLRSRERERQRAAVPGDELRRRRERLCDEHLALGRAPPQRELQREELVEREAAAGALRLVLRARAVESHDRVRAERQRLGRADCRRQRLAGVPGERERRVGDRAQGLLRQIRRRRVDGREVGRLDRLADVVGRDLEPVPARLAAEPEPRPRHELRLEPGLVEPRRTDVAGCVRDMGREDVEATAPPGRRAAHGHVEHRLVVTEKLRDRAFFGR